MRNELDFAEHSNLLSEGLFADEVILALSRFSQTKQLGEQERNALEKTKDFLSKVIEGGNFLTGVPSALDAVSAKAFRNAVDAVSIRVFSKSDFLQYVNELQSTVTKILANENVTNEKLAEVNIFFSSYSLMQFQRSRGMLESV